MSWWPLALIAGLTAPLWVKALVDRWQRQARERAERVLSELKSARRGGSA
jgi:hypothetical protein